MTVPYTIDVFHDVTIDASGDIDVSIDGGYHGDLVDRCFTAEELRTIVAHAEAHRTAYEAFKESDYEDEAAYHKAMAEFKS
jgi:hypothetical protein